jgi:hypothetical protein
MKYMSKKIKAIDIANAYEQTASVTSGLLVAFRGSRKLGLNLCRWDADTSLSDLKHTVAVFLLSVCHRRSIVDKFDFGCPYFKTEIKEALSRSDKLNEDVDYLLKLMPKAKWE